MISEIISLISFVLFIVMFFVINFKLIKTKAENRNLKLQIINLVQEKLALEGVLDKRESQSVEKTEGFLNFITQSRDWAFQYIEDVQGGLTKFIKDIEPEIEYFKEYGDVMSMQPNYYSMKKITESYEELKKLLPEDEDQQ
jgi:hypothetical protein